MKPVSVLHLSRGQLVRDKFTDIRSADLLKAIGEEGDLLVLKDGQGRVAASFLRANVIDVSGVEVGASTEMRLHLADKIEQEEANRG